MLIERILYKVHFSCKGLRKFLSTENDDRKRASDGVK